MSPDPNLEGCCAALNNVAGLHVMTVAQWAGLQKMSRIPKGPPRSKRELNRLERRDAIVGTAKQLFLKRGIAKTTMSAVAEAIGGSKATLWAHFPSKAALLVAVSDAIVANFTSGLEKQLSGQNFGRAGLQSICRHIIDWMMLPECVAIFRVIMAEGALSPELGQMFFSRGLQPITCQLTRYFELEHKSGDAGRLAQVTVSCLVGFCTEALILQSHAEPAQVKQFIDQLVAALVLKP